MLPKQQDAALEAALAKAFVSRDGKTVTIAPAKGTFYPSDQINFTLGVGVAALQRTGSGMLYMDKIHTPRDTVFDEKNIALISESLVKLAEII